MIKKSFNVTGMTCSACSAHVEKAVCSLDGAENVSVNLLTGTLKLDMDESKLSENDIIQKVISAGYGVAEENKSAGIKDPDVKVTTIQNSEYELMKKRFITSVAFLVPLMFISMGGMFVKAG